MVGFVRFKTTARIIGSSLSFAGGCAPLLLLLLLCRYRVGGGGGGSASTALLQPPPLCLLLMLLPLPAPQVTCTLTDGRKFLAEVKGSDTLSDLAVLQIDRDVGSDQTPLPEVTLGDSQDLQVRW